MSREKTKKVVFTFHSTTQAMKMEEVCRDTKTPGRLIPVPRQISAGCGMAWMADISQRDCIEKMIDQKRLELEGVYELLL